MAYGYRRRYGGYRRRSYGGYRRRSYGNSGGGITSAGIVRAMRTANKQTENNQYRKAYKNAMAAEYPKGSEGSQRYYGKTWDSASAIQRGARMSNRYYGDGDYTDYLGYIPRAIGAAGGAMLGYGSRGTIDGAYKAAKAGWNAGANFSKGYLGWGDYAPVTNQIMGGQGSSSDTISVNRDNLSGDIFFSHSEYIGNVVATGTAGGLSAFQITEYPLNCGLSETFPFLAQIAQNFTLYDFEGLIFQYKPNYGESGGTSQALGKVIMSTNYDPDAETYVNSVQMENADYAASCKPSLAMHHGVETHHAAQMVTNYYVRTGVSAKSKTFTDLGVFCVATESIPLPAASTTIDIGELWVTYRVKLSRAILYGSLLGLNIKQDSFIVTTNAGALMAGFTAKATNTIGVNLTGLGTTTFRVDFPVNISLGAFFVHIHVLDSTTPLGLGVLNAPGTLTNCQFFQPQLTLPQNAGTTTIRAPEVGVAANSKAEQAFGIVVKAPGNLVASFIVTSSAAIPVGTMRMFITQVNQPMSLTIQ